MTFDPRIQVSKHGRRFGLNSTGAVVIKDVNGIYASVVKSTADVVQNSTALLFSQLGISLQADVSSTVGSTFTNFGVQTLTSGTATAISFEIAAPVAGVHKELYIETSASEMTLGSTSTAVVFQPASAGEGSTMFLSAANLSGTNLVLRGVSATQWSLLSSRVATITIG